MLAIIGFIRVFYRAIQCKSSRLRYHLINMRMNRYFKKSSKIAKIESFISKCKLGDWFVLYQLSKNLNRPFFVDFLTHLSISYTPKSHDYGIDRVDRNTIRRGPIDPDEKED